MMQGVRQKKDCCFFMFHTLGISVLHEIVQFLHHRYFGEDSNGRIINSNIIVLYSAKDRNVRNRGSGSALKSSGEMEIRGS